MWPFSPSASPSTRAEPMLAAPGPIHAAEAKSFAHPSDDLYALFGVVPTGGSEIPVTPEGALMVTAVSSAVRLISEAVASLDVAVKRRQADGSEVPVLDHPALPFLQDDANGWTSGFEFIRDLVIGALSDDVGGIGYVNRLGDGRVAELISYRRTAIAVTLDQATGEPTYKSNGAVLPAANVVHVRSPFGRSPVTLAREAVGTTLALDRHAGRLFGRGSRPSGALKFPKGMGEEAVKRARAAWRLTHEGEDTGGRTAILYDGAEFEPFTFSSTDAEFTANRRFQLAEIARVFRVPPTMIFDLERGTWSNTEQMGREFLSYCLEPWLRVVEGALRRALLSEEERADHLIRFDRDDLTRADLATRATVINSLIASRTMSPNEGRSWLGLPPREGGDSFENPNITTTPAAPAAPVPPAQGEATPDEEAP